MIFLPEGLLTERHSLQIKIYSKIIKEEQISRKLDWRATFIKTKEDSESLNWSKHEFMRKDK